MPRTPRTTLPPAPAVAEQLPSVAILEPVLVPTVAHYPAEPAKSRELLDAEAELAALLAERDGYAELRAAALDAADADELLRLEGRRTILPSLIEIAEVACLDARVAWMQTDWLPLYDCMQQYLAAISDLGERRRTIDDHLNRLAYILSNLDSRRESIRVDIRDTKIRRDQMAAAVRQPEVRRRGLASLFGRGDQ